MQLALAQSWSPCPTIEHLALMKLVPLWRYCIVSLTHSFQLKSLGMLLAPKTKPKAENPLTKKRSWKGSHWKASRMTEQQLQIKTDTSLRGSVSVLAFRDSIWVTNIWMKVIWSRIVGYRSKWTRSEYHLTVVYMMGIYIYGKQKLVRWIQDVKYQRMLYRWLQWNLIYLI